jgi:hypothetical protein
MFETTIDTEQAFGHDGAMGRTRVRRRRLLALSLAGVAVVAGPGALAAAHPDGDGGGPATTNVRPYVVASGDTLWGIALDSRPDRDPRPLIAAIEATNHLDPGDLRPGQTILIPGDP